ncbi:MAG: YafY family transcriptional regulator [Chloroflexi bacterium]|nr:YafY family transcriptional regulator [Chloroflexota bacterium]
MANTSSRTLRLLSLLQTHRFWAGDELADRLGVSARTLRRDVDRLRELGYPVEARRGIDGGYQLAAGAALPPLVLDDDEAVALAIGLRAAAQGAIAGIEESSVRALAKVARIMPPHLRRRVDALRAMTSGPAVWSGGPYVDAGVLTTIAQACRDEERLRFAYTAQSSERSTRHVEPHRLVSLGQRWYLVAFDLGRGDWRSFRLDRLDGLRTTGMRFQPRELPAVDAVSFVRAGIQNLPTRRRIEVVVHASAATVRDRVGQWASLEEVDEGTCRLRMTVDNLDWPALALGTIGAEFEVVRPTELIDHLRDWGARFTRAAAGDEQRR